MAGKKGRRRIVRFAKSRASHLKWLAFGISAELFFMTLAGMHMMGISGQKQEKTQSAAALEAKKEFIRYVEFNPTCEVLDRAYELDVASHDTKTPVNWITLLSYAAAQSGGEFDEHSCQDIEDAAEAVRGGKKLTALTKKLKYYPYYEEAYSAVLGGMVQEYEKEKEDGSYEKVYGLCGYSPIAKGFSYFSGADFGAARSYGYSRPHLGHDMMGEIGTPIIAVEGGYVEALGWNQYGGWRIGIRSFDKKRYYYYAHLRQDHPYAAGLKEGNTVTAGDVIGYMGHTGYSKKENVNNIEVVHLHFGLELVFDESQKESDNEIWVDTYALTEFLKKNQSAVKRDDKTKEWSRTEHIRITDTVPAE